MSTRSNIVFLTPDNKVHQYYHHCDGYLHGVGEELRWMLVYAIGMRAVGKELPIYDLMVESLARDSQYESEYKLNLDCDNRLHADIEFLYVIKDNDLYYVNEWGIYSKVNSYREVIDYVCRENNKIDLSKPIKREQN